MQYYSTIAATCRRFPALWLHVPGGIGIENRDPQIDTGYPYYPLDPMGDARRAGLPQFDREYQQMVESVKKSQMRVVSYVGMMDHDPWLTERGWLRPGWQMLAGAAMQRLRPSEIGLDSVGSLDPDDGFRGSATSVLIRHLIEMGDRVWIEASWDGYTKHLRTWLRRFPELGCISTWNQWGDDDRMPSIPVAREWAFIVQEGIDGAYDLDELRQVLAHGHALCLPWWFVRQGIDPKTIV
jgi:hypothetical protein